MNDNYAVINGKRIKLTDEQVKVLGIETRKNPFERVERYGNYYRITDANSIDNYVENFDSTDNRLYDVANYFNDKDFANQVSLHQLLYRKLLKFAYDNGCEDTAEWNGYSYHFHIRDGVDESALKVAATVMSKSVNEVYFSSDEAAIRAIKEIVEPFMKEHPDFVW